MLDINKQIEFWGNGASEDLEVARELISNKRYRHGLFFLHLSLEKILKAHICKNINDIAPRIHNLVRLSEATSLSFEQRFIHILIQLLSRLLNKNPLTIFSGQRRFFNG